MLPQFGSALLPWSCSSITYSSVSMGKPKDIAQISERYCHRCRQSTAHNSAKCVRAMLLSMVTQVVIKVMCRKTFFSLPTTGVESRFCTA